MKYTIYFGTKQCDYQLNINTCLSYIKYLMYLYDIDGYTIYDAVGYYKDMSEKTIVLEVISDDIDLSDKLKDVISQYKIEFLQESVLCTTQPMEYDFY